MLPAYRHKTPFSQAGCTYGDKLKMRPQWPTTKADQLGHITNKKRQEIFAIPKRAWFFRERLRSPAGRGAAPPVHEMV
ncbi:hypothetical protein GCM10023096_19930 [Nonomuraea ferruginea]